jgi:hypothetical protein
MTQISKAAEVSPNISHEQRTLAVLALSSSFLHVALTGFRVAFTELMMLWSVHWHLSINICEHKVPLQAGWTLSEILLLFRRFSVRILVGEWNIPTEGLHGSSKSLQGNIAILPKLDHNNYFPIHSSSLFTRHVTIPRCIIRDTDSCTVINNK